MAKREFQIKQLGRNLISKLRVPTSIIIGYYAKEADAMAGGSMMIKKGG
jgi:hypothetical protein